MAVKCWRLFFDPDTNNPYPFWSGPGDWIGRRNNGRSCPRTSAMRSIIIPPECGMLIRDWWQVDNMEDGTVSGILADHLEEHVVCPKKHRKAFEGLLNNLRARARDPDYNRVMPEV